MRASEQIFVFCCVEKQEVYSGGYNSYHTGSLEREVTYQNARMLPVYVSGFWPRPLRNPEAAAVFITKCLRSSWWCGWTCCSLCLFDDQLIRCLRSFRWCCWTCCSSYMFDDQLIWCLG